MKQIDAGTLQARLQLNEDVILLDVRELIEYHTYNIGGKNVPLATLQTNLDHLGYNKTDEIIVICRAGIRSQTAQAILLQNGYFNATNLAGGLLALQRYQQQKQS